MNGAHDTNNSRYYSQNGELTPFVQFVSFAAKIRSLGSQRQGHIAILAAQLKRSVTTGAKLAN